MLGRWRKCLLISMLGSICVCSALAAPPVQTGNLPVEIFQVLDLPVSVHEALLVRKDKGYVLRVSLSNSTDSKMMGMRYSLAVIDLNNTVLPVASRTEGFSLEPYSKKSFTLKTPIAFKPKGGDRLVLMLEQTISRESIWDVLKAKEVLAAYAKGDYSVVPTVLRVSNAVDAPHFAPQTLRMPRP
ncbi:MAG TPA: hypothetical protein VFB65_00260 [Pyrinomonadaceae bacterium]|nr:hypothetical protein [Pyrinomonadaceae bacterium]